MLTTELLTQLAEGQISFNAFAEEVHADLTRLAQHIATKWGPTAVHVEDLVQEMLIAVYTQLPKFSAARGDIREFIVFRACIAARRELKRDSKHHTALVLFSAPELADIVGSGALESSEELRQEAIRLARELIDLLPFDDRQRAIMGSLARTGSLDLSTEELLAHPDTRTMFANPDPKRARHSVYRTALKLAQRAEAATA